MKKNLAKDELNTTIVESCRFSVRKEAVERYKQTIENNGGKWVFPPLQIWQNDGTNYLLDGHHRLLAVQQVESVKFVPVNLLNFTNLAEAKRYALHANTTHGEKLTREEIRANIRTFMLEGGALESDTTIANLFNVSRVLVAEVRTNQDGFTKKEKAEAEVAKALAENPSASLSKIAEKANISRATVKKIVQNLNNTDNPQKRSGVLTDCFGREIPQDNMDKYLKIKSALKVCNCAVRELDCAISNLNEIGGIAQTSEYDTLLNAIAQIKSVLKVRKPDALCRCRGDGCRICGGVGFLERTRFNVLIPEADK